MLQKIINRGKLLAATAQAPPYLAQDPQTGEYFGPQKSLAEAIAKELGVKLELVDIGWETIIAGVQSGQFDVASAGLTETPVRKQAVDFVTWGSAGYCWAYLGSNKKITDLASLNSPDVTFGVLTGTAEETIIPKGYPNAKMNSVPGGPGQNDRVADVLAGRVDVTAVGSVFAPLWVKTHPQLKILPGGADECQKNPDLPSDFGIAVAKGDPAYETFLEKVVAKWRASGEDVRTFNEAADRFVKLTP